jgi:hypothetical protein
MSTVGCLDVRFGELFKLMWRGDLVGRDDDSKIRGVVCVATSVILRGVFIAFAITSAKSLAKSLANVVAIFIIEFVIASFNAPCHEVDEEEFVVVCCCSISANANLSISAVIVGRVCGACLWRGACRNDFEQHGISSITAGVSSITAGVSYSSSSCSIREVIGFVFYKIS